VGKWLPRVTVMTTTRVKLKKLSPHFYKAMLDLDSTSATGLEPALAELVRIRASQLNGCFYCLDAHTKDARAGGETEQRLYLLSAWRDVAGLYTEKERAAAHFPDAELSQLICLIVTINAWTRIAISTRLLLVS
jgi:AhpD family alkylhydroperoxidase